MRPTATSTSTTKTGVERPSLVSRSLTLMKPITWFGPMWAFLCGAIASGATTWSFASISRIFLGILMAGPVLCGFSQVINDYFDREVDALNEPHRLIPSGMVSITQIVVTVALLLMLGVGLGIYLGQDVALLVALGLVLAVIYSAPPFRAKRNGWVGNSIVAVSYEGLAWMAGHIAFASLTTPSVLVALLYSFGSHGIMSINDYKSIAGDTASGIRTIPVILGPRRAAVLIVATMDLAQILVIAALLSWGLWIAAGVIGIILIAQIPIQRSFINDPVGQFLRYSAIGVSFFVWGMMVAAIGLRAL